MKALLDGDIFAYRTAAASEETDETICLLRLDRSIREVLHVTQSDTYEIHLSGEGNFRYQLFPDYKAHRKDVVKPKWLQQCREYLVTNWNAKISNGCEADDTLGYSQTEDSIICSIDKDLLQIPGKHYNFVKEEWYDITYDGGMRHFYEQLLKGDRADGIPGVAGLGEKKAARMLEGCETEQEMFDVCRGAYGDDELMYIYGSCLWIWRKEGDIWNPSELIGNSQLEQEPDRKWYSIMQKAEVIRQSMVPTEKEKNGTPPDGDSLDITDPMENDAAST